MLINLALLRLKLRGEPAPEEGVEVGIWVPALGFLLSFCFLIASWLFS